MEPQPVESIATSDKEPERTTTKRDIDQLGKDEERDGIPHDHHATGKRSRVEGRLEPVSEDGKPQRIKGFASIKKE